MRFPRLSGSGDGGELGLTPRARALVQKWYKLPDFRASVASSTVRAGYRLLGKHEAKMASGLLAAALSVVLANMYSNGSLAALWRGAVETEVQANLVLLLTCAVALTAAAAAWLLSRRRVFLVDFAVFRAPRDWETTPEYFSAAIRAKGSPFDADAVAFMDKIVRSSGLGPATAMPPALRQAPPPWTWRLEDAKAESEVVIFDVVERALAAAGVPASRVDILVVNCSLFNPTPSLSAMVVARFGLRAGCTTFSLGGMGCSAGLVALDLARELLASRPAGQVALVVSTENITTGLYQGSDRSMLIPACIFRVGGSAVVLSNARPFSRLRRAAKYELTHLVRTHRGCDARAHACVAQATDAGGVVGVRLSKDLMAVAGAALKANITTLGPLVLPLAEQAHFLARCALRRAAAALGRPAPRPYVPDFATAFDHFCVHTGGRAVLEEVAAALRLSPEAARPSAATLWRHGNTSSSSIWYVLAWIESAAAVAAKAAAAEAAGAAGPRVPPAPPSCAGLPPPRAIRKGDRVWQIAFGSGFKCNSAVLKARRGISQIHAAFDDFET